jgi:branched-chain amino acid aminotransferase
MATSISGTAMKQVSTGQFEGGAAFVDGQLVPLSEAKISLFDWGFTRSDATYDVVSTWKGSFFRMPEHIERFFASMDKLRMHIPYDRTEVRDILHTCVRAGGLRDSYVAMVCTRGVPPRGARDPRLAQNRFYAYALPFVWIAPREKQLAGIDMHVSSRPRIGASSVDPTVKNYHWLDMVQSLFDAYDAGRDTTVLLDGAGHVTEGPGFNVFVVKNGEVHTGAAGVLEGISRRTVIELCVTLGIVVHVGSVPESLLRNADEVFLSSTGGGVLPIARLDGAPLGTYPANFPGPVATRIHDAYWALHDDPTYNDPVDYT